MIISNITNTSSTESVKAKVELYEGSTLVTTCTCSDNLQDFTISREGGNSKFFGFGICHKLSVKLVDLNRELTVTTSNTAKVGLGDGINFDYPYPDFYITEVNRDEDDNTITATAYDRLYNVSSHTLEELGLIPPYSIETVVNAISDVLGIPVILPTGYNNLQYPEGANFVGNEHLRLVLDAIAEVTQTVYYINNQNKLVFKRLDKDGNAVHTVSRNDYFSLNTKTNRRLAAICNATELGDNVEANIGQTGTTQYIRNNPFWELRTDIDTLLNEAINFVGGITINQFNCNWAGNHLLEIGDKISLETEDGGSVISYVLNDTIVYDGFLEETTEWEFNENNTETDTNPATLGEVLNQTSARVDKVNKQITLLVNEVEQNTSKVAQIELSLDSIDATIKESVENALEDYTPEVEGLDELENIVASHTEKISGIEISIDGVTTTVSNQTTKIAEIEDETNGLKETVQTHTGQISALTVTTEGINATVTNITETSRVSTENIEEQIETLTQEVSTKVSAEDLTIAVTTAVANGVDKVQTVTGFTFNDEGLTVSKSGREMTTTITEDGMKVYKDNTAVLTADNTGVDAKNLRASTYLVIGTNSRFENYGSTRTACFWIGD